MCQLHISLTRAAQIYLELHFCVELHTKKSPLPGSGIWGISNPGIPGDYGIQAVYDIKNRYH